MRASAVARCIDVVDLPEPPFSFPTTMMCAMTLPFEIRRDSAAPRFAPLYVVGRDEERESDGRARASVWIFVRQGAMPARAAPAKGAVILEVAPKRRGLPPPEQGIRRRRQGVSAGRRMWCDSRGNGPADGNGR